MSSPVRQKLIGLLHKLAADLAEAGYTELPAEGAEIAALGGRLRLEVGPAATPRPLADRPADVGTHVGTVSAPVPTSAPLSKLDRDFLRLIRRKAPVSTDALDALLRRRKGNSYTRERLARLHLELRLIVAGEDGWRLAPGVGTDVGT